MADTTIDHELGYISSPRPQLRRPTTAPSPIPAPLLHRRSTAGRPMRSSPLAGPALSFTRIQSTPDLAGLAVPAVPIPPPQSRSAPSSPSSSLRRVPISEPTPSTSALPAPPPRARTRARPVSAHANLYAMPPPPAIPLPPLPTVPSSRVNFSIPPRPSTSSASSTSPSNSLPNSPTYSTAPYSPTFPSPPSSPTSPSSNWLTSTPYDETPRFSRLSLAAPGVVLPVSARAHRLSLRADPPRKSHPATGEITARASTSSSESADSKPARRKVDRDKGKAKGRPVSMYAALRARAWNDADVPEVDEGEPDGDTGHVNIVITVDAPADPARASSAESSCTSSLDSSNTSSLASPPPSFTSSLTSQTSSPTFTLTSSAPSSAASSLASASGFVDDDGKPSGGVSMSMLGNPSRPPFTSPSSPVLGSPSSPVLASPSSPALVNPHTSKTKRLVASLRSRFLGSGASGVPRSPLEPGPSTAPGHPNTVTEFGYSGAPGGRRNVRGWRSWITR